MSNRDLVKKILEEKGYKIGYWSFLMELLPKVQLEKVIRNMLNQKEVEVLIRRKIYIINLDRVNDTINFVILYKEQ